MEIKAIVLKGFGKYKTKVRWDFEKGVHIICGRNGSGKSTIFVDALSWVLFGDTFKGVKADDVINDNSEKAVVGIITDNGKIVREKVRGSGSVVFLNGSVVDNKVISNVVGMDKMLFFNSVVFGTGLSGFLHLNSNERKQMLSISFSDVDSYIEKMRVKKSGVDSNLILLKNGKKRLLDQIDILEKEISNFKVDFDVESVKLELDRLESKKKDLNTAIDVLLSKNVENDYYKLDDEKYKFYNMSNDYDVKIKMLNNKIQLLEKNYEELVKENKCPKCGQVISEKYKKMFRDLIMREVQELEKERGVYEKEFKGLQKKLYDIDEELERCKELLDKHNKMLRSYRVALRDVEDKIREKEGFLREYELLQNKLLYKKEELGKLRNQVEKIEDDIVYHTKVIDACNYWISKLLNYKVEMFNSVINDFVPVANRFLVRLSNGRFTVDLTFKVKGNKRIFENFELLIKDSGRGVDFERLSNGEKRMVTLGINMCFQYLMAQYYARDWNVVVFDEVFDGLDGVVRERVVDLLLELVEETGKCVVVITHDDFSYRNDVVNVYDIREVIGV